MRIMGAFILLATLAIAGPEGPGRIRYREGALEAALAEAKTSGRVVLVVVAWYG